MRQRLDERLVGDAEVVVATAVEHPAALRLHALAELRDQTGLTDSRLPADERDAAASVDDGRLVGHGELVLLGLPPEVAEGRWMAKPCGESKTFTRLRTVNGSKGNLCPLQRPGRDRLGNPFERQPAPVAQRQFAPFDDQLTYQGSGEDLSAVGEGAQSRGLDSRRAEVVALGQFGLAVADANTDVQSFVVHLVVLSDRLLRRGGGPQSSARSREGVHQPVAQVLHLNAAERRDRFAQQPEMDFADRLGARRSKPREHRRRPDQVGDHYRHCCSVAHHHLPGPNGK